MSIKEKFKEKGYKWVETEDKLIYKQKFLIFTTNKIIFCKKSKLVDLNNIFEYSILELIMEQAKELKFDESIFKGGKK